MARALTQERDSGALSFRSISRAILTASVAFLTLSAFVSESESGALSGTVSVRSEEKKAQPRRYYMGPYRSGRRHAAADPLGIQDVVLYLDGVTEKPEESPTIPPPMIAQTNEAFVPRVLPIQAGTEVAFPNRDTYYHNVFSVMAGDRFDLGRYAQGETGKKVFEKPGVVVVRCEIHPGMKAYVLVLTTTCFTVADTTGRFTFPKLRAGQYTLKAWHPTRGEQERIVAISDSGNVDVRFDF